MGGEIQPILGETLPRFVFLFGGQKREHLRIHRGQRKRVEGDWVSLCHMGGGGTEAYVGRNLHGKSGGGRVRKGGCD